MPSIHVKAKRQDLLVYPQQLETPQVVIRYYVLRLIHCLDRSIAQGSLMGLCELLFLHSDHSAETHIPNVLIVQDRLNLASNLAIDLALFSRRYSLSSASASVLHQQVRST